MPDRECLKPIDEMTCQDLRTEIGFQVGFKAGRILQKPHLNSIHAYLYGEFFCKPARLYTDASPSLRQYRNVLAHRIGFEYQPGDRGEYPSGLRYSRSNLIAILREIRETDDQRESLAYEPLEVE